MCDARRAERCWWCMCVADRGASGTGNQVSAATAGLSTRECRNSHTSLWHLLQKRWVDIDTVCAEVLVGRDTLCAEVKVGGSIVCAEVQVGIHFVCWSPKEKYFFVFCFGGGGGTVCAEVLGRSGGFFWGGWGVVGRWTVCVLKS